MSLTQIQLFKAVLHGQYESVGLTMPLLPPEAHERLAKKVLKSHGLDPFGDPLILCAAENIRFGWAQTPRKCGFQLGDLIVMPYLQDPRARGLSIHHERSHVHAQREWGRSGANEADVWLLTIALSTTPWSSSAHKRLQLTANLPSELLYVSSGFCAWKSISR